MVKRLRRKNIRRLSPAIDDLIGPIGPIRPIKSTIRLIRLIRPRKRQTIRLTEQTAYVARGDRWPPLHAPGIPGSAAAEAPTGRPKIAQGKRRRRRSVALGSVPVLFVFPGLFSPSRRS